MSRRWVLALVFATALTFGLAGTALGYWVLADDSDDAAIASPCPSPPGGWFGYNVCQTE